MKEWMIRWVLAWLAGITAAQWGAAVEAVVTAGKRMRDMTGAERKVYVVETLKLQWPELSKRVLNQLIENALGYAIKKKLLNEN